MRKARTHPGKVYSAVVSVRFTTSYTVIARNYSAKGESQFTIYKTAKQRYGYKPADLCMSNIPKHRNYPTVKLLYI